MSWGKDKGGDRVVILTGGANGIGRATAEALSARGGCRIGLIDRDPDRLESSRVEVERLGAVVSARAADVTGRDALVAAVAEIEGELGPADVLIACAGIGSLTPVPDLETAGFRAMLEVNVLGVAHAFEAVLPGMVGRGRGHLVGISSVAGMRGMPWMASYSATKAAVWAYLEAIRPALKRRGIAVSTVFPGFVATGMTLDVPFAKPVAMLRPEDAARHLLRVVDRRPRDYVFPASARLGMRLLRGAPNPLFDWMMDQAGPKALTTEF